MESFVSTSKYKSKWGRLKQKPSEVKYDTSHKAASLRKNYHEGTCVRSWSKFTASMSLWKRSLMAMGKSLWPSMTGNSPRTRHTRSMVLALYSVPSGLRATCLEQARLTRHSKDSICLIIHSLNDGPSQYDTLLSKHVFVSYYLFLCLMLICTRFYVIILIQKITELLNFYLIRYM